MRLGRLALLAAGAYAAWRGLRRPYDLTGKGVLITGGSRGMGLALAREFAARGARVALLARDADELARAAQSLRATGAEAHTIVGDVTVQGDLPRIVAEAVRLLGQLDVLVNNAGIIQAGPLDDMTEADFRRTMEINAFAPLNLTRAAQDELGRNRGRMLFITSLGGRVAVPHLGPYSMSKFAAVGLGQLLRAELARHHIGVTVVLPGLMRTGSTRQIEVKGPQEREYTLFATLAHLPVLTLNAEVAARRTVNALVRGEAEAMIGGPALLARYAQALAPNLVADSLALTARLLPGPTGQKTMVRGADVESAVTRRIPAKVRAEQEFNQL